MNIIKLCLSFWGLVTQQKKKKDKNLKLIANRQYSRYFPYTSLYRMNAVSKIYVSVYFENAKKIR